MSTLFKAASSVELDNRMVELRRLYSSPEPTIYKNGLKVPICYGEEYYPREIQCIICPFKQSCREEFLIKN